MIRAAHFSDLHYCERHLQWVDRAFSWAVRDAIERQHQLAVISGDSFDNTIVLHHPAVGKLHARVHELAQAMPVVILQGTYSHDRPGAISVFKRMGGQNPVFVADNACLIGLAAAPGRESEWLELDDLEHDDREFSELLQAGLKVIVACLPSLNPAETRNQGSQAEAVTKRLAYWRARIDTARAAGIPTILVSHGTVNGCVTESKMAMISADHEFGTAQLFDSGCSAIMLGHIHAHQGWERDGQRIAYPGSITKLIYGHQARTGYLSWDIGPSGADYVLHDTPSRQLVEIEYEGPPDMADLRARLAQHRDCYVRLRYSVDEEHRNVVDKDAIRRAMEEAGVAEFKEEGRVNPVQRVRTPGISRAASIEEKFQRWCADTGTDSAPLMPLLAQLQAGQQPGSGA